MMNVLFICIGNSCRSQMAEGFANKLAKGGGVRAWSAGLYPLGWIEASTRVAMEEKGISLEGQTSKGVDDVPFDQMGVVITMGSEVFCDAPAGFTGLMVQWEIPDPFGANLHRYREVRDLIELKVKDLLAELESWSGSGSDPGFGAAALP
jgi:arsenate reductase (thioredoxin)